MSKKASQPEDFEGYVARQLGELKANAPAALKRSPKKAVHRARVATRRLGTALRLVGPLVDEAKVRRMRKACKALRRALGDIRDVDVLQSLLSSDTLGDHARRLTERTFDLRRRSAVQNAVDALNKDKLRLICHPRPPFLRAIGKVAAAMAWAVSQTLHRQLDDFAAKAKRKPVDFHALRVAGKELRYLLEIAVACGRLVDTQAIAVFADIQKTLGSWHDDALYAEQLCSLAAEPGRCEAEPELADELIRAAAAASRRAVLSLQQFEKHRAQEGHSLVSQIKESLPLSKPVTRSRTGRGRAGSFET
jgi:CHAD domain-containing protein